VLPTGSQNHGNGIWAVQSPANSAKPKFGTSLPYEADDCGGSDVTAGSFIVGRRYGIKTSGTSTGWQSLGARASSVGTSFIASGVGDGDGVATERDCPLQSVDTPDIDTLEVDGSVTVGVKDGIITTAEKEGYLLYDICSCFRVRPRRHPYSLFLVIPHP
jgi:hypothetical protein